MSIVTVKILLIHTNTVVGTPHTFQRIGGEVGQYFLKGLSA